ncbi:hypothetical protein ACET3X_003135 [Alternaria dauci]|uniref:Peptidase A1 domain-containing protein n=1 Tax=Alternaria dauci TaxID=48095 RepID=A0ABR3URJ2_9PLEO
MLRNILFASLRLLVEAAYLDPSLQQQKPLLDSKPAPGRAITITLDHDLHYSFTNSPHVFGVKPLEHLQNTMATYSAGGPIEQTLLVNIPLNSSQSGTATFYPISESDSWSQNANQFTWMQQERLRLRPILGAQFPLLGVGMRKSGMIFMPAESATLDLSTPYIHVPKGIWDVLLLATNTEQQARDGNEQLYVDCWAMNIFPELVFGVEREDSEGGSKEYDQENEHDDDDDIEELVVKPEQYILQTTEGRCMLLAKNADSCHDDRGIIKLGWAAVRGRDVVLDWHAARVGFGKQAWGSGEQRK